MNRGYLTTLRVLKEKRPIPLLLSALVVATLLLGACGGGEATATPTLVPTATTAAPQATTSATENGALTQTEQAAATGGITSAVPTGEANVAVITSTQLITGTEVITKVNVSTNTAVIAQQLITTVITNTNLVTNVAQSNTSSSNTQTAVVTATAQLTPESSTGQAVANVTITPLPPTATPTVVVQVTRVVTATAVVTSTREVSAVATPRSTSTPQPSQGQTISGTAPVAAGTIFTGVTDAQGKTILASTLLDSKFLTSDGKISGKLDDLVIDMQTSQLLYLLLTYGGVLDVGESRVAVPLNAMSLKQDGTFLLNIPPDHLKNFPKLDDDWPQAGSPNWDTDVRKFWDNEGFQAGFDPSVSGTRIRRIDGWIGAPTNDVGLGAGTVQDMIVSLDQGSVPYVLVSFANAPAANVATATPAAGAAAGGAEWYVVPLSAFDPQASDLTFRSNVNASTFEGAPRFNRDSLGQNPYLPTNYDKDWQVFWKKLTNP